VDDDEAVRFMMSTTLERRGFDVVSAANVTEALKLIIMESFDVLITDLHMPNPSDGFAVITAMRHTQPSALTLLVSGYPDVKGAMNAILLEADDIIVKPFDSGKLAELVHAKLLTRKAAVVTSKERVAAILERCTSGIVEEWLVRIKKNKEFDHVALTDEERTGYLPKLIEDPGCPPERAEYPWERKRIHLFQSCCSPRDDATTSRLFCWDAGARLASPSGDPFRDLAEESGCFGFQPAAARRHDYRG
jgi:DNA-binding response OmpR family regulator